MDIRGRTIKMASRGVDLRTIWLHWESVLERTMTEDEAEQMRDGWRATAKERAEAHNRRLATIASEARRR